MSKINQKLLSPLDGLFKYIKNNPNAGLVVIFCCLAIISSFDGLMTLIGWIRPKEFGVSLWLWYCIKSVPILLIVILLQVVLVKALYECIDNIMEIFTPAKNFMVILITNTLASMSWLVIYVFIMGLSVFFSYQFYYRFISAENFAKTTYVEAVNDIYGKAENFSRKFATAKEELGNLKTTSMHLKGVEDQVGGTCGNKAVTGCGVFCWLRATEANEFGMYADQIAELNDKSQNIVKNIQFELDKFNPDTFSKQQLNINKLVGDANDLITESDIVNRIKQGLAARENRHALMARNTRDEVISDIDCSHENPEKIRPGIELALASLNQLQAVAAPALFDPHDEQLVQHRAWYVFKSMFITGEDADISTLDRSPIFFGVSIDVLIFLLGLSGEITKHRKNILRLHPDDGKSLFAVSKAKIKQLLINQFAFVGSDEIFLLKLLMEQRGVNAGEFFESLNSFSWQYNKRYRIFIVPLIKHNLTDPAKKNLALFEELMLTNPKLKIGMRDVSIQCDLLSMPDNHQDFVKGCLYNQELSTADFNNYQFTSYVMPTKVWHKFARVWNFALLPDDLSWKTVTTEISKITAEQNKVLELVCDLQTDVQKAKDVCDKLYTYRQYWLDKEEDFNDTWLEHTKILYGFQPEWKEMVHRVSELESERSVINTMSTEIQQLNTDLSQVAELRNQLESKFADLLSKQEQFNLDQKNIYSDTGKLFQTKEQLKVMLAELSKEQAEFLNRLDFYQQRQHHLEFTLSEVKGDVTDMKNKANEQDHSLFSWVKNHMPDFNKLLQDENRARQTSAKAGNKLLERTEVEAE